MIRVLLLKEDVFRPIICTYDSTLPLKQYIGCGVVLCDSSIGWVTQVDYYIIGDPNDPSVQTHYTHTLPAECLMTLRIAQNE